MKKWVLLFVLFMPLLGFSQSSASGSRSAQPTPTPLPIPTPVGSRQPVQRTPTTVALQNNREFELLGSVEEEMKQGEAARKREEKIRIARQMADEIYRKPTKKEMLTVTVDDDLRMKYAVFLKSENTGLIRLLSDAGCAENTNVVVASADCLRNTMPGAGSSYSFRINNYRISHLADLMLAKNDFITTGNWLQGVLSDIGDVPLESVGLQTVGVAFINSFLPPSDFETARDIDSKFLQGVSDGNFIFSRAVAAKENQTYILRSIAYRGSIIKSINGLAYNELDYDKRKDILIAFRVVRKHADGSATILWKRLAIKDSPKLVAKDLVGNKGREK